MTARSPIARALRVMMVIAVALFALAAPMLRAAHAGLQYGTLVCCCGEHASDTACGCPDCPVGKQHAANHQSQPSGDDTPATIKQCGPNATVVPLASETPAIVGTITMVEVLPLPQPITITLQDITSQLAPAPDAPPPRA